MQAIQHFNFGSSGIRATTSKQGEPLFLAKDVCEVLEIKNTTQAIQRLDEDEVTMLNIGGQSGDTLFVNESGLYSLILGSRKKEAKVFKKWVTSEVLPSIRKHGAYATAETIETLLADPSNMIKLLTTLKEERELNKALREYSDKNEVLIEMQDKVIEKQAPKVEYHDKVLNSNGAHPVTLIAKELGMSAQTLNKKLKERGIIFKVKDTWVPASKYQNKGYTKTETHVFKNTKGEVITGLSLYWTESGRMFIHGLFNDTLRYA